MCIWIFFPILSKTTVHPPLEVEDFGVEAFDEGVEAFDDGVRALGDTAGGLEDFWVVRWDFVCICGDDDALLQGGLDGVWGCTGGGVETGFSGDGEAQLAELVSTLFTRNFFILPQVLLLWNKLINISFMQEAALLDYLKSW